MESDDLRPLRCPECLAENSAGSERCTKCGAGLFPAGFDLAKFRARTMTAGQTAPVVQAASDPPEQAESSTGAAQPVETSVDEAEQPPPEPAWTAPRLYDEATEALTPEAFQVFGAALAAEARTQNLPLTLLLVALLGAGESEDAGIGTVDAEVRALAGVLRRSQHGSDLVARHGARGFAFLLSGATLAQATRTAQWITAVVRQMPPGAGERAPMVAQGIAELSPGADLPTLIRQAEEALALALREGGSIRAYAAPPGAALAPRELVVPNQRLAPEPPRPVMPVMRPAKKRRRVVRSSREVAAPVPVAKTRPQAATQTVRADVIGQEDGAAYAVSLHVDMAVDGPRADLRVRRR